MDRATLLRGTTLLGCSSSLFLSGIYFCSTQLALPLLYNLPVKAGSKGFEKLYYGGASAVGPLVAITSLCSGVSAYLDPTNRVEYAIAGIASFSTLPWTRFVMWNGIQKLLSISNDERLQEKTQVAEVDSLLRQWGWHNLARSGMAAVGGVVGLITTVGGF